MQNQEDLINDLKNSWYEISILSLHVHKDQLLHSDYPLKCRSMQIDKIIRLAENIKKKHQEIQNIKKFDAKIGNFECKIMAYDFYEAKSKLRAALDCALSISKTPELLNGSVTDEHGETFTLNFSDLKNYKTGTK